MTTLRIRNVTQTFGIRCDLIGNAALSRQGGTSASASSGTGGWQVVDRTRNKASTEWLDYYPFVLSMTCIIDAIRLGRADVEYECNFLEWLEQPTPSSDPPLPPMVAVDGPVPHADLFWVCSRLDFDGSDTGQIRNTSGTRTQQTFKLELTEYSPSTAIIPNVSPAQRAQIRSGSSAGLGTLVGVRVYTVKKGDTLQSIAARQLRNVQAWSQIAILNGLPNSAILRAGEVLSLPATG